MATFYVETPHNFSDISSFVIYDRKQVVQELQCSKRYYFYDACAFRKHVHMIHPEWLFEYIQKTDGVVIITRCILMELGSLSGCLEQDYIDFIKNMHSYGIKILILYEEDLFEVLGEVFSSNTRINEYLGIAVKTVKTMTGTVQSTLKGDTTLMNKVLVFNNVSDKGLYQQFFVSVRNNKEQGDNLGEELVAICVHLLANIPDNYKYKYIVLTEDKGAIGLVNKAIQNSKQYTHEKMITAYSTPKIAQNMYVENIITNKMQIEEVLSTGLSNPEIKIRGSERYDIGDEFKTMTCSDLAEKITIPGEIHINY